MATPRVRARDVLLVGAFVVGWSVGRSVVDAAAAPAAAVPVASSPVGLTTPVAVLPTRRRSRLPRPVRLAVVGVTASLVVAGAGLASRPDVAAAPLVTPAVVAHEHALAARQRALAAKQAETARLTLLRRLELAGIAARRVGLPEAEKPHVTPLPRFVAPPSDRAVALATYVQALGADTILRGLDTSKEQLEQQVLSDPRVSIYPGGRGDISSGRVDVRILAMIEYLAQANGQVSVTCLISGHSYFVHGRPGVVSAHVYGRAVDIGAVDNTSILGHQGPGTITDRAIRQILALPDSILPKQVISLMTLGGPSFALPDHYNHIHIGY